MMYCYMYSSPFNNLDLFIIVELICASIAMPCLLVKPTVCLTCFFSRYHLFKLLLVLLFFFFDDAASTFAQYCRDTDVHKYARTPTPIDTGT